MVMCVNVQLFTEINYCVVNYQRTHYFVLCNVISCVNWLWSVPTLHLNSIRDFFNCSVLIFEKHCLNKNIRNKLLTGVSYCAITAKNVL
jgi:hypothetical protein